MGWSGVSISNTEAMSFIGCKADCTLTSGTAALHLPGEQGHDGPDGRRYYRRARYLFDGAQYVVSQLGGQLPLSSIELLRIPGAQ